MNILKNLKLKPAILFLFILVSILTTRGLYKTITTKAPDFSIFWFTARDLPTNLNPYLNHQLFTTNPNPPHAHIFFLPLTLLPYQFAQGIFIAISILAIVLSVFLSLKIIQKKVFINTYLLALSLTLISFPAKFTLGMGQTNSIVFLLLLLSFYSYQKKSPLLSGIMLGLASSIKTTFLFFFLFFLIKKQWKTLTWATLTILTVITITLIITGPYLYKYWITEAITPFLGLQGREAYYNQGISGMISRFSSNIITRNYLTTILSGLVLAITIKTTAIKKKQELQFSLFIITLLLIDSLSWQHHFIWLIFPFITIAYHLSKQRKASLLITAALIYELISWNIKTPADIETTIIKPIILSHVFIGAVILFMINLRILRRS